jgi:hypothetical protein
MLEWLMSEKACIWNQSWYVSYMVPLLKKLIWFTWIFPRFVIFLQQEPNLSVSLKKKKTPTIQLFFFSLGRLMSEPRKVTSDWPSCAKIS